MDYKRRSSGKLSMRNSVIIWVGGAFLGWALMVVTVYNVLRFPDGQIAENGQESPGIIATDEKSLNEIVPAAGGSLTPPGAEAEIGIAGDTTGKNPEDEDKEDEDDDKEESESDTANLD